MADSELKGTKELYEKYYKENIEYSSYNRILKLKYINNERIERARLDHDYDLVTLLEFADKAMTTEQIEVQERARTGAIKDSGFVPKPLTWSLDE